MKILIPVITSVAAALSLQAEWTVVSTFDDASALDLITDVTNIEGSNARSEIVDGKWAAFPGELFENTSNLYAMLDLGTDLKAASVSSGGAVTVYLEVMQPIVPDGQGGTRKAIVDTVWGLSNDGPDNVLNSRFNGYNVMQRINSGNDNFEGRNGGAYWAPGGGQLFEGDVTYKIWFVVDFNLNYYESYIQGGQWTEQTKLDTEDTTGVWLFRNNPAVEEMVNYIQISLSRGNSGEGEKGIDPTYFDNVAYDLAGENLTMPPVGGDEETWAGYPVSATGDVNTGDWLGWVNVAHKPWILSYSLNQWMYIEEAGVTTSGSWVYVFNF